MGAVSIAREFAIYGIAGGAALSIFAVAALVGEIVFSSVVAREKNYVAFSDNDGALEGDSCIANSWKEGALLDSTCFFSILDSVVRGSVDGNRTEVICPQMEVSSGSQTIFQLLSSYLFIDSRETQKIMFGIGAGEAMRRALRDCAIKGDVPRSVAADSHNVFVEPDRRLILPEDKSLSPRIIKVP